MVFCSGSKNKSTKWSWWPLSKYILYRQDKWSIMWGILEAAEAVAQWQSICWWYLWLWLQSPTPQKNHFLRKGRTGPNLYFRRIPLATVGGGAIDPYSSALYLTWKAGYAQIHQSDGCVYLNHNTPCLIPSSGPSVTCLSSQHFPLPPLPPAMPASLSYLPSGPAVHTHQAYFWLFCIFLLQ